MPCNPGKKYRGFKEAAARVRKAGSKTNFNYSLIIIQVVKCLEDFLKLQTGYKKFVTQ